MEEFVLLIKTLFARQKVKFYTAICRACERIERSCSNKKDKKGGLTSEKR